MIQADGTICDIENTIASSSDVYSVNSDYDDKIVSSFPIGLYHKGEIQHISTSSSCVSVTDNHVFPVYESDTGEIVDKMAKYIRPEIDYMVFSKQEKKFTGREVNLFDMLQNSCHQNKILVHFRKGFVRSCISLVDLRQYGESTRYKYLRRDMLPLDYVIDHWNMFPGIKDNYIGLQWRSAMSKVHNIPIQLNKRGIAYLVGLMIADGHLNDKFFSFSALLSKNPTKIDISDIVDIRENLNRLLIECFDVKYNKNLVYKDILVAHLFALLGVPTGNKSSIVNVPVVIMQGGPDLHRAFIAGLFDGDGYFALHRIKGIPVSIQSGYTSKSDLIIKQLQILLSSYGIVSRIHRNYRTDILTLKISICDVEKLYKLISPDSIIKKKMFDSISPSINKSLTKHGSRNPYYFPFQKLIETGIENSLYNKNQMNSVLGIDVWSYLSHDNNIGPHELRKLSDLINNPILLDMSRLRYEKVLLNQTDVYDGYVYCLQTENGYFQVENGLITHNCSYIRTDSYNISKEAIEQVRDLIKKNVGSKYLPQKPRLYAKKKSAASQEAHECIRPTDCSNNGSSLSGDEKKMYKLIRERFVSCQMSDAIFDTVTYDVKASSGHALIASGQTMVFDGWTRAYSHYKAKELSLPNVVNGESLEKLKVTMTKSSTKAPPRYTEGSLVKVMEDNGVGRPSTYASIMESIQKRGYVKSIKKSSLQATDLGMKAYVYLQEHFKTFIMDIGFTASLESDLDVIENGDKSFIDVVSSTYGTMTDQIEAVTGHKTDDQICSKCGEGTIVERHGKFGIFYACDKFPACKTIYVRNEDGTFTVKDKSSTPTAKITGIKCPACEKGEIVERHGQYGKFYACTCFPLCRETFNQIVDGKPIKRKSDSSK